MFLVSDTLDGRQELIRSYTGRQATLGALLAVIDFEWTVRRAIIALGYQPTKLVRADIDRASGIAAYKEKWRKHVYPYRNMGLPDVVPDWAGLKDKAFLLRHKIVHGVEVTAKADYAVACRDYALDASLAVCNFSLELGFDLYSRLPVRHKVRDRHS
jgi:hypothetical protein